MKMQKFVIGVITGLAVLCWTGCACYHWGTPGGHKTISVAAVENRSMEPTASAALKASLHEQFATSPALQLAGGASEYILNAEVVRLTNSSIARAEVRDKESRNRDSDAYQTVLFRIEMTVSYTVTPRDPSKKQKLEGTIIGRGDLPLVHDRNVALQAAIKQAANDAALQVMAAVADWKVE